MFNQIWFVYEQYLNHVEVLISFTVEKINSVRILKELSSSQVRDELNICT